jgi:hypothetical protein
MQIIFNGKSYNSLEEMPANEREAYESMFNIFKDANGNGIPDFLEGDIAKNVTTAFANVVNYNGQVYGNLDELPPEAREKVKAAFVKLNNLGLIAGTPMGAAAQPKPPAFEPAFKSSKPLLQQEPAFEESGNKNWIIILGFLGLTLLCAAAFAVYMFMK